MAMKETASKCFIALTLCDILYYMETKKTRGKNKEMDSKKGCKRVLQ